jgi:hypothetical protein
MEVCLDMKCCLKCLTVEVYELNSFIVYVKVLICIRHRMYFIILMLSLLSSDNGNITVCFVHLFNDTVSAALLGIIK